MTFPASDRSSTAAPGSGPIELDRLYRDHAAAVADSIWRRTGDAAAAEDIASQVFLAAARALPRWRDRGIPIRHWLLRIATREVIRWAHRRRRAEERLPDDREPVDPASVAPADSRDAERVRRALLTLPARHQEVVALHHIEGTAVDEVARLLDCAPGTVKSRLARARATLMERLAAGGFAEDER